MIRLAIDRQSMKSARVCDIITARFFQGDKEKLKPNFVITKFGERIMRVKIVGVVVEKFRSDDGRFANVTVDDGTGAIQVRVFSDDFNLIENVNVGELVAVIGKVRSYHDENYILPELVKGLSDPNSETFFKLELLRKIFDEKKISDELKKARDQMSDEELEGYASEKYGFDKITLQAVLESRGDEVDYKPIILEVMDKLDAGGGVEIGKLLEASKIDESMAEGAVSELIASGEVYEPVVGKLKRVRA